MSEGRNKELDAARGIAALSVAAGHCITHVAGFAVYPLTFRDLHQLADWQIALRLGSSLFNADSAVVLFFVLSGHVLSRSLERRREGGAYFVRRAFRLFPVGIVAALPFIALLHPDIVTALGTAFLVDHSLNGVIWSLQVELVGSVLVFVLVMLRSPGTALLSGLSLFVAAIAWNQWLVLFLPAFVLGYFVPVFWRRAAASRVVLLVAVLALLFADLLLGRTTGLRVAQMFAAYVVVACLAARKHPHLETAFPQFLGAVSYPFYLLHPSLMMIIPTPGGADGWPLVGAIAMLAVLSSVSALAVSWLVHIAIEKPFIRIGNRIVALPRSVRAADETDGVLRRE